jgi:hypothetical protein
MCTPSSTGGKMNKIDKKILAFDVAVVGLGYVGLPLVLQFAKSGYRVLGLDIDPAKIKEINAGVSSTKLWRPGRPPFRYGERGVPCGSGSTWRIWQTPSSCCWRSMMGRGFSISVPARKPPSGSWQNGWRRRWGTLVGWSGTPLSRTAPHARRWTQPVSLSWVGGRGFRYARVCKEHIRGIYIR